MILSSKISLEAANTGKQDNLALFIAEYRKAMAFYVDYLWIKCAIDKQKYRVPNFGTRYFCLSIAHLIHK